MKKLVCMGCGAAEDLTNPTGAIHTMQLIDLTPPFQEPIGPDSVVEEDLCARCRERMRRDFFGVEDGKLLEMPLMKGV